MDLSVLTLPIPDASDPLQGWVARSPFESPLVGAFVQARQQALEKGNKPLDEGLRLLHSRASMSVGLKALGLSWRQLSGGSLAIASGPMSTQGLLFVKSTPNPNGTPMWVLVPTDIVWDYGQIFPDDKARMRAPWAQQIATHLREKIRESSVYMPHKGHRPPTRFLPTHPHTPQHSFVTNAHADRQPAYQHLLTFLDMLPPAPEKVQVCIMGIGPTRHGWAPPFLKIHGANTHAPMNDGPWARAAHAVWADTWRYFCQGYTPQDLVAFHQSRHPTGQMLLGLYTTYPGQSMATAHARMRIHTAVQHSLSAHTQALLAVSAPTPG